MTVECRVMCCNTLSACTHCIARKLPCVSSLAKGVQLVHDNRLAVFALSRGISVWNGCPSAGNERVRALLKTLCIKVMCLMASLAYIQKRYRFYNIRKKLFHYLFTARATELRLYFSILSFPVPSGVILLLLLFIIIEGFISLTFVQINLSYLSLLLPWESIMYLRFLSFVKELQIPCCINELSI